MELAVVLVLMMAGMVLDRVFHFGETFFMFGVALIVMLLFREWVENRRKKKKRTYQKIWML